MGLVTLPSTVPVGIDHRGIASGWIDGDGIRRRGMRNDRLVHGFDRKELPNTTEMNPGVLKWFSHSTPSFVSSVVSCLRRLGDPTLTERDPQDSSFTVTVYVPGCWEYKELVTPTQSPPDPQFSWEGSVRHQGTSLTDDVVDDSTVFRPTPSFATPVRSRDSV